jgi:hypothetical protein
MHTLRFRATGQYEVGYWKSEGMDPATWEDIGTFDTHVEAAAFVNYLNGGAGKVWVEL